MCGIAGYWLLGSSAQDKLAQLKNAVGTLNKRGPDYNAVFTDGNVGLGHARLSIIDTSEAANQPLSDPSGKYTIIFNGEIYNFKQLRRTLERDGIEFRTQSDTEVLLELYKKHKTDTPEYLNGFFAFAVHDHAANEVFMARDRLGIKPLFLYRDEQQIAFASEIKALVEFGIDKTLDWESVHRYFQLNYIPGPRTIFQNVHQVNPGAWVRIHNGQIEEKRYYQIPQKPDFDGGYQEAVQALKGHMLRSVEQRLVADVPVGTFLSGGIDSSIIAALTAKLNPHIESFSIGFPDDPYFDETDYAKAVAKKIGVRHHIIGIHSQQMLDALPNVLDYFDQPFADSSALPLFMLCREVGKHVTVALSGDGADELFGGYRKHMAHHKALTSKVVNTLVKGASPFLSMTPQSRHSKVADKLRQIARYSDGVKLKGMARYWFWASISSQKYSNQLLLNRQMPKDFRAWESLGLNVPVKHGLHHVLGADVQMVLPGDMLTKVDRMSMANSLEVRVPFLDHELVDFALRLPDNFKIHEKSQKRILQDTFRDDLPEMLYNRPKKGFEIPLLNWFRHDLDSFIFGELLNKATIENQRVFDYNAIRRLKKQLHSNNPGDAPARIWALVVFQHWYNKYID
jgi:asparagine synthase (glutamine-hydrolysing)